jgi:hypothetical protein
MLAVITTPAIAQPVTIRIETPRDMAGILGTIRIMTTECKLAINSSLLGPAARKYGYNFTDFVPTGRFFELTKKAMDEDYALIAQRGLGPACRSFSQLVELAMPELLAR